MRIATEMCHRCASAVYEEDIESGKAFDALTCCLCPRCARPAPPKARPVLFPRIISARQPSLLRLILLLLLVFVLGLAYPYLSAPELALRPTNAGPNDSTRRIDAGVPALSPDNADHLRHLVAQYQLRRSVEEERLYRDIRDQALAMIENGRYADAVNALEQFPEEFRTTEAWEMRLAPLWREAQHLRHASSEYAAVISRTTKLLEKQDCRNASDALKAHVSAFPHTPWAAKVHERAALLDEVQSVLSKSRPSPAEKPARPVPPESERDTPAPAPPPPPAPKKLTPDEELAKRAGSAISNGVRYVRGLADGGGAFRSTYSRSYPAGPTALALLALLKCGENRESELVEKGFECLAKLSLKKTYSVSLYMLALEAKYEPHGDEIKPDVRFEEQLKKRFTRSASKPDRQMANAIVAWLRDSQLQNAMWTYSGNRTSTTSSRRLRSGAGDGSNTQFAVLALYAAHRLGIAIPEETVSKLAKTYLDCQQQSSKEVEPFAVPAADMPIYRLRQEEKKAIARRGGPHTVSVDELYGATRTKHRMYARGWGYSATLRSHAYLSMTCAGVCNLVLAKAVLERHSGYSRNRSRMDDAIRNGAAYIGSNLGPYMSSRQSSRMGWGLYYTLYSVERAGMLTLCEKFGKRSWYREGAELLLRLQAADGSWGGSLEDTCFALLFLSRSTTPFIRTSGPIYTGPDLFPGKKK